MRRPPAILTERPDPPAAPSCLAHHYLREELAPVRQDAEAREAQIATLEALLIEQAELNDRLTELADSRSREHGMDPEPARQLAKELADAGFNFKEIRKLSPDHLGLDKTDR